jgi:hypothetical protein
LVVVVIFATFSLVEHKELRFIFPAVPLILTLVGLGSARLANGITRRLKVSISQPVLGFAIITFWIIVSAYLSAFTEFHYLWSEGTGTVAAFQIVNADPNTCGVAIEPIDRWAQSGGYVFLRPGIPLVNLAHAGNGNPSSRYSYIFTYGGSIPAKYNSNNVGDVPADRVNCWDERAIHGTASEVCLWHVREGCTTGHSVPIVVTPPPFVIPLLGWAIGD